MIDIDTLLLEIETLDAEVALDPPTVFVWSAVAISCLWLPALILWLCGAFS